MTDEYTMEMRLCDADGMVSHKSAPDCLPHKSYLDVLNVLRKHTKPHGEHKPVEEPFRCTGSAHLAGRHIKCTSPAHARPDWSAQDAALRAGPAPTTIGHLVLADGTTYVITGAPINGWQVSTTGTACAV